MQMLTRMESQISKMEFVDAETDDEEQVEERDQEPGTSQFTGPSPSTGFASAIYSAPETVTDSVSSPAFNLPHHVSLPSVRSRLSLALHPCPM